MKVVKNGNNPLSQAELKASQQFEASAQAGQVLFHPQVAAGQPAPDCVALFEGVGRFGVTILEGTATPSKAASGSGARRTAPGRPLTILWKRSGRPPRPSVRNSTGQLGISTYVIAVAWFPDMDEDDDIFDEADGRSVRLLFGQADPAQQLASFPGDEELQTHLSRRFIKREMEVLSPAPAAETPPPAGDPQSANERTGALTFQQVDTVNIYVTVVNGMGDDPSLITVQGQ